jgi:hypothetical protein
MDCLSPSSPVQRVALMKGAQIGGTECGNCWVGYVIHQARGPMMAVAPTVELAKRNSKQRIDPLIEESEVLRERVKERRSRDSGNTVLSKEFPGGVLILTGANSAVGLRSMPARYLFLDEVDGYPGDVEGEGDPILLAERRSATFQRRKISRRLTRRRPLPSRLMALLALPVCLPGGEPHAAPGLCLGKDGASSEYRVTCSARSCVPHRRVPVKAQSQTAGFPPTRSWGRRPSLVGFERLFKGTSTNLCLFLPWALG